MGNDYFGACDLTALKTCSWNVVTGNSDKYDDMFIVIKILYDL